MPAGWRIVVFAKAPIPGTVKTRLRLGPAMACRLHEAFVADTLARLAAFPEVELCTDRVTDAWPEHRGARTLQRAGSLGERMLDALVRGLSEGRSPVAIVGSDSPTLPPSHLKALLGSSADVALGPTEDGGYYAISCRRAHPAMFDGVTWSTEGALAGTQGALARAGLSCELGPRWWDVDEPADLLRLAECDAGTPSVRLARAAIAECRPYTSAHK